MPFFVDTGFWIALSNKDDRYHKEAALLWERVLNGQLRDLFTTDYVLDEAISHAALDKTWGSWDKGRDIGNAILSSSPVKLLEVTRHDIDEGWKIFLKYKDKKLSFTDCVSMAVMDRLGATEILGFDGDFEIVGRGYHFVR